MPRLRPVVLTASLLLSLAVSVAAIAMLIAFPQNVTVWNACAWTLTGAAMVLLVATPVAVYGAIRHAATRTWPRLLTLTVAVAYLAVLALLW